jgi:Cu/Ag efflux pump CusA
MFRNKSDNSAAEVARNVQIALNGTTVGLLHRPESREDVPIEVRLARSSRSDIDELRGLRLPTPSGPQVSLAEVTRLEQTTIDTNIYRKNMRRVVYVTAMSAGRKKARFMPS